SDQRRSNEKRLVYVRRSQVLLEQELHAVRQGLQKAERPHTCWSPSVLDASDDFALQPDGVRHCGEQDERHQQVLDEGRNEKHLKTGQGRFLSRVQPCTWIECLKL